MIIGQVKFSVPLSLSKPRESVSFGFDNLPHPVHFTFLPYSETMEARFLRDQRGVGVTAELGVQLLLLHDHTVVERLDVSVERLHHL